MDEQTVRRAAQIRRLLFLGFGGLLVLLALTGVNAISVLKRIQTQNESIRRDYVNRDRILEQLRSDIYLSGTYVRDLLLEPDAARADVHRKELDAARTRIDSMIVSYAGLLLAEERPAFRQFRQQVQSYFDSLRPALDWNADQRSRYGYAFMRDSLLPRRLIVVQLADQISRLNQRQLEAGNRRVSDLFSSFRKSLIVLLIVTFASGLALAAATFFRLIRLEQLSAARFEELLEARTAQRKLSARLLDVQETERRAISRELHDEVGQAVSAILLGVGNLSATMSPGTTDGTQTQLQEIRQLAEKTVVAVRDMSLLLRPSMLDDLGLIPALEWQAREVSRTNPVRVSVDARAVGEELPEEQKTCIYRVVQEALRNVIRHARARNVQIRLARDGAGLHLNIQDDGQGFDPVRTKGVGLLGMEERVRTLRGSFELKSHPGGGTTIMIELPNAIA